MYSPLATLSGKIFKKYRKPTAYQYMILGGLQSRPFYEGTANRNKLERRRAKNKVARRSRRINRG